EIGPELLGEFAEHNGVDDLHDGFAHVPPIHPGQHHLDRVVTALDELLAGHGREIEHDGMLFFSYRRRHTRWQRDWSSDVCSSDLRNMNDRVAAGHGIRDVRAHRKIARHDLDSEIAHFEPMRVPAVPYERLHVPPLAGKRTGNMAPHEAGCSRDKRVLASHDTNRTERSLPLSHHSRCGVSRQRVTYTPEPEWRRLGPALGQRTQSVSPLSPHRLTES